MGIISQKGCIIIRYRRLRTYVYSHTIGVYITVVSGVVDDVDVKSYVHIVGVASKQIGWVYNSIQVSNKSSQNWLDYGRRYLTENDELLFRLYKYNGEY